MQSAAPASHAPQTIAQLNQRIVEMLGIKQDELTEVQLLLQPNTPPRVSTKHVLLGAAGPEIINGQFTLVPADTQDKPRAGRSFDLDTACEEALQRLNLFVYADAQSARASVTLSFAILLWQLRFSHAVDDLHAVSALAEALA